MNDKIREYFDSSRLNQGTLKQLYNPKWIKLTKENSEQIYFRVGSAIDCILTEGMVEFNKQFAVLSTKRPTGKMGVFIDTLPLDLDETSDIEEYRIAYNTAEYKGRLETIITKLWNEERYKGYYIARKQSGGKTILTVDEYEQVMHCYENLINNPWTRKYFMNTDPNIEIMYQVPIYFDYILAPDTVPCKALLDGIYIDNKNKTIRFFDLKTTGMSITSFPFNFLKFGYHIQAAFYQEALKYALQHDARFSRYSDYKLLNSQFVVTEKLPHQSNPARIYELTDKDLKHGMDGGKVKGKKYEGVFDLMIKYIWHGKTNQWDYPKELYDSNGVVQLNIFD